MIRKSKFISMVLALAIVISLFNVPILADTNTESDQSGDNTNREIDYQDGYKIMAIGGDRNSDGSYENIDFEHTIVNVECSQKFKGTKNCGGSNSDGIGQTSLKIFLETMARQNGTTPDWDDIALMGIRVLCAKSDPDCKKPVVYTTDKRNITKEEMANCINVNEQSCKDWKEKYAEEAWEREQGKGKKMNTTQALGISKKDMGTPECEPHGPSAPGVEDYRCCEPPNDANNPPECNKKPDDECDPTKEKCDKDPEDPENPEDPKDPGDPGDPGDEDNPEDETFECDGQTYKRYINKRQESAGEGFVKGVSHVRATLDPVNVPGLSSLGSRHTSYWFATHVSQVAPEDAPAMLTPYGKYIEENRELLASLIGMGKSGGIGTNSNYRRTWERFLSGADAAIAKGVPKIEIDFNAANQVGYARGGAWTFTEWRKDTKVEASHKQDYYDKQDCEQYSVTKYYYNGYTGRRESYTSWEERVIIAEEHVMIDGNYTEENIEPVKSRNYIPYKSYQVINVRCNQDEFARLMSSTGSTIERMGPAASSGISPIVKYRIANFYNGLGVDFYYSSKGCEDEFKCTSAPNIGASNDSANNIQDKGEQVNGLFGAQSGGKSSSKFSFFRDNISKEIRNDVWWLNFENATPSTWSFDTKKPSEATFITLDTNATPLADMFNLEDESGNVIISGSDLQNGKNALLFRDQRNVFNWRASWASERAKPHKMNTRYAYKPKSISDRTPGIMIRDGVITNNVNEEVVDMYCDVKYNTTQKETPIISNLPAEDEYKPIKEFVEDAMRNLIVQFVKSSAE